jgi:hypothetical protein
MTRRRVAKPATTFLKTLGWVALAQVSFFSGRPPAPRFPGILREFNPHFHWEYEPDVPRL